MKRVTIFALCLMLTLTALLSACGDGHKIGSNWKTDDTNHWRTCSHCEEVFDLAPHSMQEETQNATCTQDGYVKHTCTVCGFSYKDTLTHSGHAMEKHDAVESDCVNGGSGEYYSCSVCKKYYSDAAGEHEIAKDSWLVKANGHQLLHIEAIEATKTQEGNVEYYTCSACHKNFSDAQGKEEITTNVKLPQLISSVADARSANEGDTLIVRGIVIGVTSTGASKKLQTALTLKDENSNAVLPLSGGVGTATKLSSALGTTKDLKMPYEKGTILQVPVVVSKTNADYACGNALVRYLDFVDSGEELSTYQVGKATNYAFDFTDESIPEISTQAEFFKFLGLVNGSNVSTTEGFAYSAELSGSNTYKLVRMKNLEGVLHSSEETEEEQRHWRPMFGAEYNTWAKTSISNSSNKTNNIGAKQSYYPTFYNYNTFVNAGATFSQLVFGDTSAAKSKDWKNHFTTDKTVYCLFIGGNDYYAHFAILDASWVVSPAEAA